MLISIITLDVVKFFGFFKEPSVYYLVFELVTGGELFDEIVTRSYYNENDARCADHIIIDVTSGWTSVR